MPPKTATPQAAILTPDVLDHLVELEACNRIAQACLAARSGSLRESLTDHRAQSLQALNAALDRAVAPPVSDG